MIADAAWLACRKQVRPAIYLSYRTVQYFRLPYFYEFPFLFYVPVYLYLFVSDLDLRELIDFFSIFSHFFPSAKRSKFLNFHFLPLSNLYHFLRPTYFCELSLSHFPTSPLVSPAHLNPVLYLVTREFPIPPVATDASPSFPFFHFPPCSAARRKNGMHACLPVCHFTLFYSSLDACVTPVPTYLLEICAVQYILNSHFYMTSIRSFASVVFVS